MDSDEESQSSREYLRWGRFSGPDRPRSPRTPEPEPEEKPQADRGNGSERAGFQQVIIGARAQDDALRMTELQPRVAGADKSAQDKSPGPGPKQVRQGGGRAAPASQAPSDGGPPAAAKKNRPSKKKREKFKAKMMRVAGVAAAARSPSPAQTIFPDDYESEEAESTETLLEPPPPPKQILKSASAGSAGSGEGVAAPLQAARRVDLRSRTRSPIPRRREGSQ